MYVIIVSIKSESINKQFINFFNEVYTFEFWSISYGLVLPGFLFYLFIIIVSTYKTALGGSSSFPITFYVKILTWVQ